MAVERTCFFLSWSLRRAVGPPAADEESIERADPSPTNKPANGAAPRIRTNCKLSSVGRNYPQKAASLPILELMRQTLHLRYANLLFSLHGFTALDGRGPRRYCGLRSVSFTPAQARSRTR
jgi:hypothetical protein